jgi:signal transduction histidine kinase
MAGVPIKACAATLFLINALLCSPIIAAAAASEGPSPSGVRILIVFETQSTLPAAEEIAQALYEEFDKFPATQLELYTEYLDIVRFPLEGYERAVESYLEVKYGNIPLDVVIAIGPVALAFMLERRDRLFQDVPMLFGGVGDESGAELQLPDDVSGQYIDFDTTKTIDLAKGLQPYADRIVVFTGSAPFDRRWLDRARAQLGREYSGLAVDYVTDLSLEGFMSAARALPADTILLVLTIYQDVNGRIFVPRAAAAEIAAVAGAPSYGVYNTNVGEGFVGGVITTFEAIGKSLARQAQGFLSGDPGPQTQLVASPVRPIVDWRQLERWGLDPARLPDDTELRYHEPSVWERYRLQILGALAVILLQAGTIVALIVQNRKRRDLSQELALERLELAHLSRSSQLGELSGAFAHELNQPLTSIMANAEAGARLLQRKKPDLKEIGEIFDDIIADDRRAASVTGQLRQLMLKGETSFERIDLNDAVASTIALANSELVARRVQVDFRPGIGPMRVRGNAAQLQQIVLNLMLNAADAMADLPSRDRRIDVEIRKGEDGTRVLAVSDRGPGLSPEMREKAFEPFVSTKANGLGLGLAICRTIAEAHGGALRFDETTGRGARAVLTLPSFAR